MCGTKNVTKELSLITLEIEGYEESFWILFDYSTEIASVVLIQFTSYAPNVYPDLLLIITHGAIMQMEI